MTAVLRAPREWPGVIEWTTRLPRWFILGCADEQTDAQRESWLSWWRGLDPVARIAAEKERHWGLGDWLYYLEPDERQWFWWSAEAETEDQGTITLEVLGWPSPVGALVWLLRTAGAESVKVIDD